MELIEIFLAKTMRMMLFELLVIGIFVLT